MPAPPLPNLRTINAFLRGCVRVGAVAGAEWSYRVLLNSNVQGVEEKHKKQRTPKKGKASLIHLEPDNASYEYLVNVLCQGLRLDTVASIIYAAHRQQQKQMAENKQHRKEKLESTQAQALALPALYVSFCRAAALAGRYLIFCRFRGVFHHRVLRLQMGNCSKSSCRSECCTYQDSGRFR
jgi:hypothetical protein